MAVPFRKISKTRGRMRRTHYKIEAANTVLCKNCGASIKPHRVCPECGFYKGKNVVEKEEASLFTKAAAINMRNSFNHPDFWEIINIYIPADKSKRFNPIWKKK